MSVVTRPRETPFPDVKPFPTAAGPGVAPIGHNRPPLEEQVVIDFNEALQTEPHLMEKINALLARKDNIVDKCTDADQAGKYADGAKAISTCIKTIEALRETQNRPLLTAQRALKGRADSIIDQLKPVDQKLRAAILAFNREEEARAAAERERQQAIADAARKAAEEEAARLAALNPEAPPPPPPVIDIAPAPVEVATIRGDLGSQAGTTKRWRGEVEKVRQLPDRFLTHPDVIAVLNKLLTAEARSTKGKEIKGARVWQEESVSIR